MRTTMILILCLCWRVIDGRPQQTRPGCWYEGKRYQESQVVNTTEPCLRCRCNEGSLRCRLRVCPRLPSPPPSGCTTRSPRDNACCAELVCGDSHESNVTARRDSSKDIGSHDNGCLHEGVRYGPGSAMMGSRRCEYCYCISGNRRCLRPRCLLPLAGCTPVYAPHSCCPVAYNCTDSAHHPEPSLASSSSGNGCRVESRTYDEGEMVRNVSHKSDCDNCFCAMGGVRCVPLSCAPPLQGCTPIVRQGHCCPSTYNCSASIEVKAAQNYASYAFISKDYAKFRKETNFHSINANDADDDVEVNEQDDETENLSIWNSTVEGRGHKNPQLESPANLSNLENSMKFQTIAISNITENHESTNPRQSTSTIGSINLTMTTTIYETETMNNEIPTETMDYEKSTTFHQETTSTIDDWTGTVETTEIPRITNFDVTPINENFERTKDGFGIFTTLETSLGTMESTIPTTWVEDDGTTVSDSSTIVVDEETSDHTTIVSTTTSGDDRQTLKDDFTIVNDVTTSPVTIIDSTECAKITNFTEFSKVTNFTESTKIINSTEFPEITNFTDLPKVTNFTEFAKITNFTDFPEVTNFTELPKITNFTEFSKITNITEILQIQNFTEFSKITNSTEFPKITNLTEFPKITNFTEFAKITNFTDFPEVTNFTEFPKITNFTEFANITNFTEFAKITNFTEFAKITNFTEFAKITNSTELGKNTNFTELGKNTNFTELGKNTNFTELGKNTNFTELGKNANFTETNLAGEKNVSQVFDVDEKKIIPTRGSVTGSPTTIVMPDDIFVMNVTLKKNVSVGHVHGVTMNPVRSIPPDIEAILNITNRKKGDDYDYEYSQPTLPPSLPNVRIIPFVAADALVKNEDDDNSAPVTNYPMGSVGMAPPEMGPTVAGTMANFYDIATQKNRFSPPIETEGGFVPREPPYFDPLYHSDDLNLEIRTGVTVVPADITNPHRKNDELATNCRFENRDFRHGDVLPSSGHCIICICYYGEVACSDEKCPPLKIGCRRLENDKICCGKIVCVDSDESPTVVLDRGDPVAASPRQPLPAIDGIVSPDPFRDVIKTEPAPDLPSLIEDMIPYLAERRITKPSTTPMTSSSSTLESNVHGHYQLEPDEKFPIEINNDNIFLINEKSQTMKHSNNEKTTYSTISNNPITTNSKTSEIFPSTNNEKLTNTKIEQSKINLKNSENDDSSFVSFVNVFDILSNGKNGSTKIFEDSKNIDDSTKTLEEVKLKELKSDSVSMDIVVEKDAKESNDSSMNVGTTSTTETPTTTTTSDAKTTSRIKVDESNTRTDNLDGNLRGNGSTDNDNATSVNSLLKLAGCNIYGRMYRVGRIITELSSPCLECRCTEVGVQCKQLEC